MGRTPLYPDADVTSGPGGVPAPVVRIRLAPPFAGEREHTLPLADWGRAGMGTELDVDGRSVWVMFALYQPRSLVTASVGAALAASNGGRFDGSVETATVRFDVERPVRRVAFARPLAIGPLSLPAIMVRTGDSGSAASIPDVSSDPDEVVVVATGKKTRGFDRILIGRDTLARCSSIVFDKPAKLIRLTCA